MIGSRSASGRKRKWNIKLYGSLPKFTRTHGRQLSFLLAARGSVNIRVLI
jgi:hypothetical protein